ncbi:MAG: HAMP domain-containing histidine kinase [Lachnospiraceae bacterium]|nr:HAMP domain-containing histidine kinase [Lachnospiraceae bacterium]
MFENKTIDRIEKMLDSAMEGTFTENDYDESKLSRLESKWKKYLYSSQLAKNQLDETKSNLEALIADISHQTKTPMANLKLYSELLGERINNMPGATEEDQKLLSQIREQTEKLDFLIMSLTKMSRLESNIIEVKPVRAEVDSFVKEVTDAMRFVADKKGISLRLNDSERDGEADNAVFDIKWTREALSNIIDNAIKYSSEKSTIKVSIIPYEMYVAISVQDEGKGIEETEIAKIFDRFYRSDENYDVEGVGLGLYLAREILKRENGYIKVKSDKGKGSEFIIYLWRG